MLAGSHVQLNEMISMTVYAIQKVSDPMHIPQNTSESHELTRARSPASKIHSVSPFSLTLFHQRSATRTRPVTFLVTQKSNAPRITCA